MDLGLKGKVALVLASSKGLGRASAAALAAEGAYVTIGARNSENLLKAATEIQQSSGSRVLAVPVDVTKEEQIEDIVEATVNEFGHLDILVNNAGGPPPGNFSQFTSPEWQSAFELTFLSVVRAIRLVIPYMQKQGEGRIINIASVSVKQPIDGLMLSNAIRPAVIGLAKSLSLELASSNITINNVCPGSIMTDRLYWRPHIQEQIAQGVSETEVFKDLAATIPMQRIGRPEDIGALVAFLASRQANYITGTTIQVDGGVTRSLF